MYDRRKEAQARLRQRLVEHQRNGTLTPALRILLEMEAQAGDSRLLDNYLRRHHIDEDSDALHALAAHNARGIGIPIPPPSPAEYLMLEESGDYTIASILPHRRPMNIHPPEAFRLNVGVVGGTGLGKTNTLTLLALGIAPYEQIGCWIYNIRDELSTYVAGFISIPMSAILPNLFERRKYLAPEVQAEMLADLIGTAFYMLWAKSGITIELALLYRRGINPSLHEVAEVIRRIKAFDHHGLDTRQVAKVKGVFNFMEQCLGERASSLRSGFQPMNHWNEKLVVKMDLPGDELNVLHITWLLWTLYQFNIAHNLRNRLRTFHIIDESKYVINVDRERRNADFGAAEIEKIICTQRSGGLSIAAATQTELTKAFLTNVGLQILLRTKEEDYFDRVASSMALTRQQRDWCLMNLNIGDALINTFYYPKPILCHMREVTIEPQPDDAREKRTAEFLKRVGAYTRCDDKGSQMHLREQEEKGTEAEEQVQDTKKAFELVAGELAMLRHIVEHPAAPVSYLYRAIRLTRDAGNRAKDHLVENGLATFARVRMFTGRGGTCIILDPTARGVALCREHCPDAKYRRLSGRGGIKHRVVQHMIARWCKRQGWVVKKEAMDADLGVRRSGKKEWEAYEVAEEEFDNLEERVKRNRKAGATKTTIVIEDKQRLKEVRARFEGWAGVAVGGVEEYLLSKGESITGEVWR